MNFNSLLSKTHIQKTHEDANNEKTLFPIQCDFCEKELKTENEFKLHMKTHSYKRAEYKCQDCEFCGENELTMEVHLGKQHSDKFECGLCGFVTNNLEHLDIHLFTCEIYICLKCREGDNESEPTEIRLKSLPDMKKHLLDGEHFIVNDNYYKVIHAKQDRGNKEEIQVKTYVKEDLIPNKKQKKRR